MRAGPPARVLLARLNHELEGVRLAVTASNYVKARDGVATCIDLANQLGEAV
jgi:hypothetical protein